MSADSEQPALTRTELYDRVWNEPLSRVAKALQKTDVALRQRCHELRIPIPDREYWKRKRNGLSVRKIALPPEGDIRKKAKRSGISRRRKINLERYDSDIAQRIAFEQESSNRIFVPKRPTAPHPMVLVTKEAMKSAFRGTYDRLTSHWRIEETLTIEVYEQSISRALALLDALLKALQSRGYETAFRRSTHRNKCPYEVTMLDHSFHFVIRERFQKVEKAEQRSRFMTDYEYRPTGELRLLVCRGDGWGPMFTLSDGETLLEDRLNEVVIKLLQEIQKSRHQEIRNRQEAIEREAAERVRRKAEEKQRKERERQKHFLTAATDWARCVELRQYIEAVREEATQRSGPKLSHELNAWLDWANGYVDTLSPLARDRPLPRIDSSDVRGNPTDETND